MVIRSLLIHLFVFLASQECLISQAHYGIGRNDNILNDYEYFTIKFDTSKTPQKIKNQDGDRFKSLIHMIDSSKLSTIEKADLQDLYAYYWSFFSPSENTRRGAFFKSGRIFSFQNQNVSLQIDPLIYFGLGRDEQSSTTPFRNTRGISISGDVDKKVFFRTSIYENQVSFLPHIERRIDERNAIPGQGFYKKYNSRLFDGINGWDFLNAEGVLTYKPSEHFRASLGHGSFFIGRGYSSLILSDYADNFFFVELNTSIGRFNYRNIFAELAPIGSTINQVGDPLAPKKYMAAHLLSFAFSHRLEVSLFESVIFGRENHFEFQYLNPLILYRVVEQKVDSPDNVLLGLDVNYRIGDKTLVYGQLLIDELKISEILKNNGWWGNKVGYQLGVKHYNLFDIERLNIQIEYNSVRPYTYSHRASEGLDYVVASYSHYNQELAHPLGANFREIILLGNYRFSPKWSLSAKFIKANVGKSKSLNVGQNTILPNDTRVNDFSNKIGQGENTEVINLSSTLTYKIYHQYYADLLFAYRNEYSESETFNIKSIYFGVSFRVNMSHQKLDY